MATKLASRPGLYESDFYVWAEEQAALLRAKRFDALDLEHLIEEVEGLGDAKRSAVLNNARVIMEHLLKLEYSPTTDPRNKWRATVREHRNRLEADLTPRLLQVLDDELARWYGLARKTALAWMHEQAAADALPKTCPYTRDQVTGDWMP
jgi:Domain of unknown function DUF29